MPNIVPGALWKPIDVGNRAARRKGRGLIGHIAVVNSTLLIPGPLSTRPSDWHFYLPKNPYPTGERFAQLIDLDLQSWSSAAGNATCPAFESEGGIGADVNGPWTPNQIESAAIILAYLHRTEGVPLQDMVNSLPTSRGFGIHRYGIDPYRVAGGEKWSSVYAKACPGDVRARQVPQIVARAQQIAGGTPAAPTFGDDMAVISSPGRGTAVVGPGYFRQLNAEEAGNTAPFGPVVQGNDRQFDLWRSIALGGTTAVWSTTVFRADATTDGKGTNVPALQELADAKTQAAAVNAQLAGFQAALAAVDTGKGGVDVDAIRAAVDAAVRDSIQSIDVTVNTKAAQ